MRGWYSWVLSVLSLGGFISSRWTSMALRLLFPWSCFTSSTATPFRNLTALLILKCEMIASFLKAFLVYKWLEAALQFLFFRASLEGKILSHFYHYIKDPLCQLRHLFTWKERHRRKPSSLSALILEFFLWITLLWHRKQEFLSVIW